MNIFPNISLPDGGPWEVPNRAVASAVLTRTTDRFLVVTKDDGASRLWHRDLLFFADVCGAAPPAVILSADEASPGDRIRELRRIASGSCPLVVASVDEAREQVADLEEFDAKSIRLAVGDRAEPAFLADLLTDMGYRKVSIVADEGEFAVRGGIVDLYCAGGVDAPHRIEFFGDTVESIRLFEIDTQRSIRTIDTVEIPPGTEPKGSDCLFDLLKEYRIVADLPEDADLPGDRGRAGGMLRLSTVLGGRDNIRPVDGNGVTAAERNAAGETMEDTIKRLRTLAGTDDVLVVCESRGEAERVRELFRDEDVIAPIIAPGDVGAYEGTLAITRGTLSAGYRSAVPPFLVLSSAELFGFRRPRRRPPRQSRVAGLLSSLDDLSEGDMVVHQDHGVGRYLGLRRLDTGTGEDDVLTLEYAGGDLLHIPISRIGTLRSYHGAGTGTPRIDRLGGTAWKRRKSRVRKRVREMAEELVRLYAERSRVRGYAFPADPPLYEEFVSAFPFEETADQLRAEQEIFRDMEAPSVMDRLLCGDVGYGKTEVAMRAAFKAVSDGGQVAILVPTTILAEQHYETFAARFSPFPVTVDFLSRFKTPTEQRRTVARVARGEVDIVVGTHRLLAKDMSFHNLALLIVDEEHKFGVSHKERLKQLSTRIDVLTLTATPIPRTLHMALSGIRGISTIETAPEERMAVKTLVAVRREDIIREALERELKRNGQAYFVHNRVETIYRTANRIQEMFPGKTVAVGHGQMREKELEEIMHRFFHGAVDLLVCTSIIGSGLDVPTANTIVIDRADMFGLADLYQLRGRVGRSDVRAYAYLLIPGEDIITDEARKRLQAIRDMSYLGAGFRLALKDLEIRGAGNILGGEQSGHIDAVGFDLYTEMLEDAVAECSGRPAPKRLDPSVDLPVDARIPNTYLEDTTLRFTFYRRLSGAESNESLDDIRKEMEDRFGPVPDELARLFDVIRIKILCRDRGLPSLKWRAGTIAVTLPEEPDLPAERLLELAREHPDMVRFDPGGSLRLTPKGPGWDRIKETLDTFFAAFPAPNRS